MIRTIISAVLLFSSIGLFVYWGLTHAYPEVL